MKWTKLVMVFTIFAIICPGAAGRGRGRYSGKGADGMYVLVAASDSSKKARDNADHICDGTADEVQIQDAIDSIIATGGKVELSAGTFNIAATVILHGTPDSGEGVHLAGAGMGLTVLKAVASTSTDILEWTPAVDEFFLQLSDFTVNGNKGNSATGHAIFVSDTDGGAPNDMQMHNLFIINAGNIGFNIVDSWGFRIIGCIAEFCNAAGLLINGSQNYVSQCFFAYNNAGSGTYSVEWKNNVSTFVGNTVYDDLSNEFGFRCFSSQFSSITANTFRNFTTGKPALYVTGMSSGTVISNNSITGNAIGIRVKDDVTGALITNNNFYSNTADYTFDAGQQASIFSNTSDKPFLESKLESMTNTSGANLENGDIVVLKAVASGTETATTTTAGDDAVYGMAVITTLGTAVFTNGDATVTGTNTNFTSETVGRNIKNDADGTLYTVASVTSTTSLELSIVFAAATTADEAYTLSIANNTVGRIQTLGHTTVLKVDGTADIAIGDFIATFTTAKIGQKATAGDMAIAIAREAYTTDDSAGVIDAILITPRKL